LPSSSVTSPGCGTPSPLCVAYLGYCLWGSGSRSPRESAPSPSSTASARPCGGFFALMRSDFRVPGRRSERWLSGRCGVFYPAASCTPRWASLPPAARQGAEQSRCWPLAAGRSRRSCFLGRSRPGSARLLPGRRSGSASACWSCSLASSTSPRLGPTFQVSGRSRRRRMRAVIHVARHSRRRCSRSRGRPIGSATSGPLSSTADRARTRAGHRRTRRRWRVP